MQTALFVFKVDRNLLPSHLIKCFYQNSAIHRYFINSFDNNHLESVNTNIKKIRISYEGPILWNFIPLPTPALNNINLSK